MPTPKRTQVSTSEQSLPNRVMLTPKCTQLKEACEKIGLAVEFREWEDFHTNVLGGLNELWTDYV